MERPERNSPGPVRYASEEWWTLLEHAVNEAERHGLEMGIFNGAGWSSTGAAFVIPDKAIQKVAWTGTKVKGEGRVKAKLPVPKAALGIERDMKKDPVINRRYCMPREHVEGWFKDIAVYAVPAIPENQKPWTRADWRNKAACGKMTHRFQPDARQAPAGQVIAPEQILDISQFMNAEGELEWDAPTREWTILRMGCQPTGRNNHPASQGGRGLEIDKISAGALDFHWVAASAARTCGRKIPPPAKHYGLPTSVPSSCLSALPNLQPPCKPNLPRHPSTCRSVSKIGCSNSSSASTMLSPPDSWKSSGISIPFKSPS